MNHLRNFADTHNLMANKTQAWGHYKGYQFTIGRYSRDNILTIFTAINTENPEEEQKITSMLAGMKAAKLIRDYKNNNGSISITKTKALGQVSKEELEYLLDKLVNQFVEIGAKPACFNCKNEGEKAYANYNGINLPICDTCYNAVSENLTHAMNEHKSQNSNYTSGILGAILGALLGSIIWIAIGLIGYIASIAGFAISAASAKGYTILNGKITRVTPWIIGLASLLALVLAQFITLDLVFYKEIRSSGYDISLMEALKSTFSLPFINSEVTASFIKDTALGFLFAGLGAYSTFSKLSIVAKAPAGSLERI